MNNQPAQVTVPERKPEIAKTLRESLIVAVLGALFAFAANEVSPRGLALTRNYFPVATRTNLAAVPASAPAPFHAEPLAARLQARGLQVVDGNQAAQLFHDPGYEQELIVFIDARDDLHYQAGHIPGAYQFDHYHPENHLATVLPVCRLAEQIIVYCTGGNCEDSEFAAITLAQAGIAKEKLSVYVGGMTEWATHGLPIEIGGRKSGQLRPAKP